jgi:formyl-CoA transferase
MRILEFGDNIAAGYAGRLFALAGHEVIRVDRPARTFDHIADEALDRFLHTDKQRPGIDYTQPAGRQVLNDLANWADVVVTDVLPAVLDQLDWDSLGAANPTLVRVSITPFGLTGPYRDWSGPGPVLLAMAGLTHIIGDPDREPLSLPLHYAEYQSGQYAYVTAGALLLHRLRSGDGGRHVVDVSMLETVMSLSQFTTVMWTCSHEIRGRHGNRWANMHPIGMYRCSDGWFLVNVVPGFWQPFAHMLGRPDLLTDPRFSTNTVRLQHRDELDAIINERLGGFTMAELMELGQRQFRVPTGGAMTFAEILDSEHLAARGFFREVNGADGRIFRMPGSAFRTIGGDPQGPGYWRPPGSSPHDP